MAPPKLPRKIEPASIRVGDLIRVRWTVGDVTRSALGKVAYREYEGEVRVLYAADGQELLRWTPSTKHDVILIKEAPDGLTELFQLMEA